MNKIQEFMLKHPYVSMAAILPFAFTIVMGLFSIILNIITRPKNILTDVCQTARNYLFK